MILNQQSYTSHSMRIMDLIGILTLCQVSEVSSHHVIILSSHHHHVIILSSHHQYLSFWLISKVFVIRTPFGPSFLKNDKLVHDSEPASLYQPQHVHNGAYRHFGHLIMSSSSHHVIIISSCHHHLIISSSCHHVIIMSSCHHHVIILSSCHHHIIIMSSCHHFVFSSSSCHHI